MIVRSWQEELCTVLRVSGELDVAAAPRLRAELEPVLSSPGPLMLVMDLSEVPFCDSVGLGVLVSTHNHARRTGGRLILVLQEGMISNLLTITNLNRHFETSPSLTDAQAALAAAA